jgi:hypothetical protein
VGIARLPLRPGRPGRTHPTDAENPPIERDQEGVKEQDETKRLDDLPRPFRLAV